MLGCARRGCRSGGGAVGAADSAGVSGRVRASSAVLVVGCKPAPRHVGEPDWERAMRLPGVSGRVRASSAVLVVGCKPAPRRVGEADWERAMRLPH